MGSHIGVAWTLLFNFLKAYTETCEDYGTIGKTKNDIPHTKHLVEYKQDETVQSLNGRWKKASDNIRQECSKDREDTTEVCTYAWMVRYAQ